MSTKLTLNTIEIIRDQLDDLGEWSCYNNDLILEEVEELREKLNLVEQKVMAVMNQEEQDEFDAAQQRQSIYDYSSADGMAGEL